MQTKLPYEQHIKELGNNMPVPDMDMAWHEMELLLDKEDDDKIIIPWYKRIGCMVPALLLLAGLIIGSIFYFVNKKNVVKKDENVSRNKNETASTIISEKQNDTTENINLDTAKLITNNDIAVKENNVQLNDEKLFKQNKNNFNSNGKTKTTITGAEIEEDNILTNETKLITTKNKVDNKLKLAKVNRIKNEQKEKEKINNKPNEIVAETNIQKNKKQIKVKQKTKTKIISATPEDEMLGEKVSSIKPIEEPVGGSSVENNLKEIINIKPQDTTKKAVEPIAKKVEVVKLNDSTKNKIAKKKESKKASKYFLSTGLSILQQLPLNGAKANSLDYLGRNNNIKEYLPAPYVRITKENKFYLQGEFRYGAPQNNKPFVYSYLKNPDTPNPSGIFKSDTSYTLRRSFYHQVPISFHFYITPKLSIGTGIVYNKFYGVIAEQEFTQRRQGRPDTSLGKFILPITKSPDSAFTKTFYEVLFEAQYKIKKFEIGARYAFGLDPYIVFINPVTKLEEKKYNQNFNFYIRYELWNSKKKKK